MSLWYNILYVRQWNFYINHISDKHVKLDLNVNTIACIRMLLSEILVCPIMWQLSPKYITWQRALDQ